MSGLRSSCKSALFRRSMALFQSFASTAFFPAAWSEPTADVVGSTSPGPAAAVGAATNPKTNAAHAQAATLRTERSALRKQERFRLVQLRAIGVGVLAERGELLEIRARLAPTAGRLRRLGCAVEAVQP